MNAEITEIEVDFTSKEMLGVNKAFEVTDSDLSFKPSEGIDTVEKLEEVQEVVGDALNEDIDTKYRMSMLVARKNIKDFLEGIEE